MRNNRRSTVHATLAVLLSAPFIACAAAARGGPGGAAPVLRVQRLADEVAAVLGSRAGREPALPLRADRECCRGRSTLAPGGIGPESRQTLEHIRAILERHGATLKDVVKCTVFLADMGEWGAFNAVYREFFTAPYPARSALGSSGLAFKARVEVECVAVVP